MVKVGHWFALLNGDPLSALCPYKPYEGWTWANVCVEDPDWILWLLTESRILIMPDLEKKLLEETRKSYF